MDGGAIAGIVLGCVAVVIILVLLFCKCNSIWPFEDNQEHVGLFSDQQSDRGRERRPRPRDWLIKRCEQDNPGVRHVENEIIKRMNRRNETWTQDLDDGQTPVLVFCVTASRIGTDIESALKGVSNHHPLLVVLHCKNKSSLRGDLSDDDYLLDQALRDRVTGIAHFAFSESDGFYSCRHNSDGYRMLSDHITKAEM